MTVAENQKLENTIRAVLEDVFGAALIGEVHVVRTYNEDDEEILLVYVAFNGTEEQFDATLASGVVRHMRPRLLEELTEDAFPVISYLSDSDMKMVKNAMG